MGDLRLTGGLTSDDGNAEFGRLEIFNDGGWGTVCNRPERRYGVAVDLDSGSFTEAAIDVACMQLGYAEGARTPLPVRPQC